MVNLERYGLYEPIAEISDKVLLERLGVVKSLIEMAKTTKIKAIIDKNDTIVARLIEKEIERRKELENKL
jgi:hypothetical protein